MKYVSSSKPICNAPLFDSYDTSYIIDDNTIKITSLLFETNEKQFAVFDVNTGDLISSIKEKLPNMPIEDGTWDYNNGAGFFTLLPNNDNSKYVVFDQEFDLYDKFSIHDVKSSTYYPCEDFEGKYVLGMEITSNGKSIVFIAVNELTKEADVEMHIFDLDTGKKTEMVKVDYRFIKISPDDRKILIYEVFGSNDFMIYDLETKTLTKKLFDFPVTIMWWNSNDDIMAINADYLNKDAPKYTKKGLLYNVNNVTGGQKAFEVTVPDEIAEKFREINKMYYRDGVLYVIAGDRFDYFQEHVVHKFAIE